MDEEERKILARKWKRVTLASPANCMRRPGFLAELAWQRWKSGSVDDAITLSPIYLHTSDPIPD
jgi:tRNA threonylcarbamoyladenosine biosynthesis protein TsaB